MTGIEKVGLAKETGRPTPIHQQWLVVRRGQADDDHVFRFNRRTNSGPRCRMRHEKLFGLEIEDLPQANRLLLVGIDRSIPL